MPTSPNTPTPILPRRVDAPVEVEARPAQAVHVILPVYNEEAGSAAVVSQVIAFAAAHPEYHFLFVDDGSSDGTSGVITSALLDQARDPAAARVRLLTCRANGGKGHAVARGIQELSGDDDDPVLFTDGDLAYSLNHLPLLVESLKQNEVVIGSRRGPQGGYGAHLARNTMGWAYNRMARWCLGAPFRDTQAGLKGFRLGPARRIFAALRQTGFGFDVELLYLARRFGYRIGEVPAQVSDFHKAKASRVSLLRDPRRMFIGLAAIRLNGFTGVYDRAGSGRRPLAAISFDAEEFDLPGEYGTPMSVERQMQIGGEGMELALELLEDIPAVATFFTTAAFARVHPDLIQKAAAAGHEIASHARVHTGFEDADLEISRKQIEEITGVPVRGFRRPRFAATDPNKIAAAGYTYDSSINPIWLPGRYNNWKYPRRAFLSKNLLRIPCAATPLIRWPLFWLSFKNAPQWSTRVATRWILSADNYAALCYHPWELCDLANFDLPHYIKRVDGRSMHRRLLRYLRWLSRRATFVTYSDLEARFRCHSWPFGPPIAAETTAPASIHA
jgi:hypothetical protein